MSLHIIIHLIDIILISIFYTIYLIEFKFYTKTIKSFGDVRFWDEISYNESNRFNVLF